MSEDLISAVSVLQTYDVEDFELLQKINSKEVQAYTKKLKPLDYSLVTIDRKEADRENRFRSEMKIERSKRRCYAGINSQPFSALEDCLFKREDIDQLWSKKGVESQDSLNASQKRHYGQLREMQKKFKDALSATVKALLYCQEQRKRGLAPIKTADFEAYMDEHHGQLPNTYKEAIRTTIRDVTGPNKYIKGAGFPKKKK